MLIFGLIKAYYTCIKSILCPELEEREKRTESQEQQSTELEDSQLQKEKFLGREFQESQDSQRDEVRNQIPTPSDDESHGVRDQSLESQHVANLSPEPQDIRKHQVRDQTQTPRDDRRYQGRNQSLRYQDVGRCQVRDQMPIPRHEGEHEMADWNQ